jgi:hypothetical protein
VPPEQQDFPAQREPLVLKAFKETQVLSEQPVQVQREQLVLPV